MVRFFSSNAKTFNWFGNRSPPPPNQIWFGLRLELGFLRFFSSELQWPWMDGIQRDPKELVTEVDSSVVVLIGMLLLSLSIWLTPTDNIIQHDNSANSCMVDSLEPLLLITLTVIAFIQGAVILSKSVRAMYTTPSLKPPLKIKVLACTAWMFVAVAHMLSMIMIVMTCEVKLKRLRCLPKWTRMTFITISTSVIMGYFYVLYAWLFGAPDDASDAIDHTTCPVASCITRPVPSPTVAPAVSPTTGSPTSITTPFVTSPIASSIAYLTAPDH